MVVRRITRLTILVIVASIVVSPNCARARTDRDVGPPTSVDMIRHDLPLLLAQDDALSGKTIIVDWVVTDGREAAVSWHAGRHFRGVVALALRGGKWWWRGAAATTPYSIGTWTPIASPAEWPTYCGIALSGPPSGQQLLSDGLIDRAVASHLSGRLPGAAPTQSGALKLTICDTFAIGSTGGGYDATFQPFLFGADFYMMGHAPADWQRPAMPGSRLYYVFDLQAWPSSQSRTASKLKPMNGDHTIRFTIWFPYVLDRSKTYTLGLSKVTPPFPPVRGTLQNNVLTFQLPLFGLAGKAARGEIDGI